MKPLGICNSTSNISWWQQPSSDLDVHACALCVVFISIWALRFAHNSYTAYKDARAVFIALCLFNKTKLQCYMNQIILCWYTGKKLVAGFSALAIALWCAHSTLQRNMPTFSQNQEEFKSEFLRPCMIPCRTTHTRTFPTKHSFTYSYLYVGIPVGWQGHAGSILSAEDVTRKTWFSVVPEDYLERGAHPDGLLGKLRDYLISQKVSPERFPHSYLVTAPRFLGFSFNPVSFWYLYDRRRSLTAMILEVNNTFDERRMYYMERKEILHKSENSRAKFAQEWPKDFHVSPFNDRSGVYSVHSTDPCHASDEGVYKVDNNIILKTEDGKPKLTARVFSMKPAMDATEMSVWQTSLFVLRWWWVGFMTNPRILKEARTLWAKKLHVYYRPEVFSSGIGRNETPDEMKLEVFFRSFLEQMAVTTHLDINYTAAAGPLRSKLRVIRSTPPDHKQTRNPEIEIRVLTPAFYSQVVRHNTFKKAFDRHCFQAAEGEAMIVCAESEIFRLYLARFSASMQASPGSRLGWTPIPNLGLEPFFLQVLQSLLAALRGEQLLQKGTTASDFDLCVRRRSSYSQIKLYYRVALKLLLADRIAGGWMPALSLGELSVWFLLVLVAASATTAFLGHVHTLSNDSLFTLLKLCGVHVWSILI